jgi:alkylation response protein AidB-like acyl-CoA dehydrogenase
MLPEVPLDPNTPTTSDPQELEAFRSYVRTKIRENLPDDIRQTALLGFTSMPKEMSQKWGGILYGLGRWSIPNWSVENGGPGWSLEQQYIFEEELALAGAPRLQYFNSGMLGPALVDFGTEDQKRRYLPGLVTGKTIVCQGYSEPDSGSDLASLRARAVRDGDEYILNGTKTWTTNGHTADLMFGLFRTSTGERKQEGITVFLIDMPSEGITVEPIMLIDGIHEVNQTVFENVRVSAKNVLGEPDKGWALSKTLLQYERFGSSEVGRSYALFDQLLDFAKTVETGIGPLAEDPVFRDRITDIEIDLSALAATERRFLLAEGGGAEASLLKIRGSEIQNEILDVFVEILGPLSIYDLRVGGDPALDTKGADQITRLAMNMRKTIIYGGTNEIQKNIIAKSVLGLR